VLGRDGSTLQDGEGGELPGLVQLAHVVPDALGLGVGQAAPPAHAPTTPGTPTGPSGMSHSPVHAAKATAKTGSSCCRSRQAPNASFGDSATSPATSGYCRLQWSGLEIGSMLFRHLLDHLVSESPALARGPHSGSLLVVVGSRKNSFRGEVREQARVSHSAVLVQELGQCPPRQALVPLHEGHVHGIPGHSNHADVSSVVATWGAAD
jgi:hypothetical protein